MHESRTSLLVSKVKCHAHEHVLHISITITIKNVLFSLCSFISDKVFLEFFFKRLKVNNTGSYEDEFPYISPCGRERNFVNCDDVPAVFTHVLNVDGVEHLSYCGAGDLLTVAFEPEKVCMLPESGRVYHPGPEKMAGIGLIKSSLAIEMSKDFEFENGEYEPPTHFTWRGKRHSLTNEVIPLLREEEKRKKKLGYRSKWMD